MPDGSLGKADGLRALGFRARVLAVLLIAGVPGVIFGVAEAVRAFALVETQNARAAQAMLERQASRFDEIVGGAAHVLSVLSRLPSVARGGRGCDEALGAAVHSVDRYGFAERVDANGRSVCVSDGVRGLSVGAAPWFEELRQGARYSVSALTDAPSGEPALIVSAPMRNGGRFDGALLVSIRRDWLAETLREQAGEKVSRVRALDRNGAVVADVDFEARAEPKTWTRTPISGGALRLEVAPTARANAAAPNPWLVAFAPVLAILLTALVVWVALDVWVMRWFRNLHAQVRRGGADPTDDLAGAPPEFRALAAAFRETIDHARARQEESEAAALSNRQLTRDLHHRVKNNLQILVSLITRQQKRAENDSARRAIAETRCRLLAVALVHRYLDPPEHLGVIHLDAYIAELARQAHAALFLDGRRARLLMEIDPAEATAMRATAVGLMLVETLIAGARAAGHDAGVMVRWRAKERQQADFLVEISGSDGARAFDLDGELVRQIARQAGAQVDIGPRARVAASFATPTVNAPTTASFG